MLPTTPSTTIPPQRSGLIAATAAIPVRQWSSEAGFTVAGAAAVIGLGSPWELPHLAAAHGGGAFLLVYLAAIVVVAIPLLQAELVIGRRTRRAPVEALAALARRERRHPAWRAPGFIGAAAALGLLAVYGAVGGRIMTQLVSASGAQAPVFQLAGQLVFLAAAGLVAGAGLRWMELTAAWVVRTLLLALGGLLACAVVYSGNFIGSAALILTPNFGELGTAGALLALRQACFTLGLGATVMMAYGAYLPEVACIPRSSARIAAADTAVSLLAGLAVMPFVVVGVLDAPDNSGFAQVPMTVALGDAAGGVLARTLFLLLLLLAAYAAAVALLEPAIGLVEQRLRMSRRRAAACTAAVAALLGAVPAIIAVVHVTAVTFLITLGAAGTALFAGRVVSRRVAREELALCGGRYRFWWVMVRWAAPAAVGLAALGLR